MSLEDGVQKDTSYLQLISMPPCLMSIINLNVYLCCLLM